MLAVPRYGAISRQAGVEKSRSPDNNGNERRDVMVNEERLHVFVGEQQRVAQVGERVDGGPSPAPSIRFGKCRE